MGTWPANPETRIMAAALGGDREAAVELLAGLLATERRSLLDALALLTTLTGGPQ